ncbi:MAG: hypothetical protein HXX18_04035 [Bacteroidetes bacterium]|nr:hypothetical protein [Bacteroidota bacterium]
MKRKLLQRILLIIVFFTFSINDLISQNQIMVTVNVLPPFTTNLSDYADNPGKVSVTLTNISGQVQEFYLQAKLAEESRGILLIANQNNVLGKKITMNINESRVVDYQTVKEFFDKSSINMQGITEQDLLRMNGVPEGIYTFCVQAFSYSNPGQVLSLETNCATLFINAIEPPILQQPYDEAEIIKNPSQFIPFSWSMPPGAEPSSNYKLTIIEMLDPNRDKNDIFISGILPPFFETTINTNIFPYSSSQPQLVEGRKYAWAVTITNQYSNSGNPATSGFQFKNNGRSEIRTFTWIKDTNIGNLTLDFSSFEMVSPEKDNDTVFVNDTTDFFVNAAWFNKEESIKNRFGNSTNNFLQSNQIKNKGIEKYKWTFSIKKSKDNLNSNTNFSYITEQLPPTFYNTDTLLPLIGLKMSLEKCDSIGFINGNTYQVKIVALDKDGNKVEEADRIFKYSRTQLKSNLSVKVKGTLMYSFDGYSDTYPIPKTIFKLVKVEDNNIIKRGIKLKGENILSQTEYYGETKEDGSFTVEILKSDLQEKHKEVYKMLIQSKYYKQPDSLIILDSIGLIQNIGQITTKVISFSLKLNVVKVFASNYKVNVSNNNEGVVGGLSLQQSLEIDSTTVPLKTGIPIIIYRKAKPEVLPPIEGDMKSSSRLIKDNSINKGFIKVATAKTQLEMINGKPFSYVVFNKLICNNPENLDDKYYILASENPESSENGQLENNEIKLNPYKDSTFTADEKLYTYTPKSKNKNLVNDTINFNATADYLVKSVSPPTSKIHGQLVYVWGSDNKVKRPMANTKFDIVVEYLVNGKPMPIYNSGNFDGVTKTFNGANISQKDKNGVENELPTADSRMVVASGKTDNDGQFTVNAININKKGDLGTGTYEVASSSSHSNTTTKDPFGDFGINEYADGILDKITQPDYLNGMLGQTGFLNFKDGGGTSNGLIKTLGSGTGTINNGSSGLKNQLNFQGPFLFDETNYEEIPETETATEYKVDTTIKDAAIKRVFRVVFTDELTKKFYYNPDANLECQAFEQKEAGIIDVYVREMIMNVKIKKTIKGNSANVKGGIKVIVYREPNANKTNLPTGEGDGKARMKKLLYSNFAIPSLPEYTTDFEWVKDTTTQPKDGKVNEDNAYFDHLLMLYSGYKVEASSDPSQDKQYFNPGFGDYPNYSLINESNTAYGFYYDTRKENIPLKTVELSLDPFATRIGARVFDQSNGKPIANAIVTLTNAANSRNFIRKKTDADGYVQFLDRVKNDKDSFFLKAEYYGYSNDTIVRTGALLKEGQQFIKNPLLLYPNSTVKGKLVNEKNEPVDAYVMRQDSSYESTNKGEFNISIPCGLQKLYFIPKDVAYFNDSLILFLAKGNNKLNDTKIFKRLHRIKFIVIDNSTQKVIYKARLSINNSDIVTTSQQGEAKFEFENISYQNFTVKVLGPYNSDYIPQLISFTNNESKNTETFTIKLKKGGALAGKVKMNGNSISGARIYLAQQQSNQQPFSLNFGFGLQNIMDTTQNLTNGILPLLETYTDHNGNYTLHGIPASSSALEFKATLDTTFTVIGDSKNSSITSGQTAKLDFNLTQYNYMKIPSLYGFPIKIEKLELTSDSNVVKVTGIVDLRYSQSSFTFLQGADMARVNDVLFTGTLVNGKRIGIANGSAVEVEAAFDMKFKYTNKYNVLLEEKMLNSTVFNHQLLKIRRDENNKGYIQGKIHIVDNSFNFPSSYLKFNDNQEFYLCNITNNKINNIVKAISSQWSETEALDQMNNNKPSESAAKWNSENNYSSVPTFGVTPTEMINTQVYKPNNSGQLQASTGTNASGTSNLFGPFVFTPIKQFNLCNSLLDSIQMKLVMFDAVADPYKSYVSVDGKIYFAVKVKCEIANAKPSKFSIDIPEMILDNNSISSGAINKPLKLELEKWTLEVNNWSLNPVKGGFYSQDSYLRTGQVDIPVRLFNLRNDMLVIDSFLVTNISLGKGVINLSGIDKNNVNILFDTRVGSDMSGHWRVNISGKTYLPAARILGMKNYLDNDTIDLEYVQLLSNNENILSLRQGMNYKVNRNALTQFKPTGITSGDTYFALYGDVTLLNAPRITSFPLTINFSKGMGNNLIPEVQPTYMNFEGRGFVEYKSKTDLLPFISKDSIIIKGTVEEKDALPKINCTFYGYANNPNKKYEIILVKDQSINMFQSGQTPDYKFKIDSGGIVINNTIKDWDLLSFSGKMLNKTSSDNIGENRMKFTVYGDIQVSGSGMEVSNLSSFPGFKMTYDLPNKRLTGSMHIPQTDFGAVSVAMDAEMLFDTKGWYLGAAGNIIVPAFPLLNAKAGIIIGNYPTFTKPLIEMLKQYSPTADICDFKNGISGFYLLAGKPILNINESFGGGPVAFSLKADIGLEADFLMDFKDKKILLGAGIYGIVKAEMSTITCTNINGFVDVRGRIKGGIENGTVKIAGSVSTGFGVDITQGIPTFIDGCKLNTTIFSSCVASEIKLSSDNGFKFSLSGDCSPKNCGE